MEFIRVEAEDVPETATQHMVAMRDGARLATDVYLPDSHDRVPAILVRLPYDKNSRYVFFEHIAKRATARGYAMVVQDVRGKFRSEGVTLGWVHEANDGYDSIDWVSKQPWCNGTVGMFGDSYYGFTQWAAVSSSHPALRAIVPRVTSANLGTPTVEGDGVRDIDWLVLGEYMSHYWVDRYIYDFQLDWSVRPLMNVFESAYEALGNRSATLDMMAPRLLPVPVYPDGHPFAARPVPVLHAVGWFDNLATLSMRDYVALRNNPAWAAVQYLTADSHDHENYHLSLAPIAEADDHGVNEEALDRMLAGYFDPALDFYDVFLKGERPAESLPRVRWHLGHVGFREASRWPPENSAPVRLFLDDLPSAAGSGGSLVWDEPGGLDQVEWPHDPAELIPSAVPNSFAFLHEYPDEASVADRPDVLTFTTSVSQTPLDIAGPVDLLVGVASTAPTIHLFAKLYDLGPDGTCHMIVRGQAELLDTSGERLLRVELGHSGYRLRPGHRLRLTLCSSDYPEYVPHPGTEENPWLAVDTTVTTQTLRRTRDGVPYLELTVLPQDG
jgi:uncharacterized protein